jgi:hypothetical protein
MSVADDDAATRSFDAAEPSIARVYNYTLGGKDHFSADRQTAEQILDICPVAAQLVHEGRQFLARAVGWVAQQGVGQFVDIGAGLPVSPAIHELAREVVPSARVVYADNDPMVVAHARALLATGDGLAAMAGDVRDPEAILTSPELTAVISLAEPTCVIMASVLHFLDTAVAQDVTSVITNALAAGSYVIISVAVGDREVTEEIRHAYKVVPGRTFNDELVAELFGGLDLVEPGLTEARQWRSALPQYAASASPVRLLAGVARKPG